MKEESRVKPREKEQSEQSGCSICTRKPDFRRLEIPRSLEGSWGKKRKHTCSSEECSPNIR